MNDPDRHDQIESLTELKRVLDDETADADDIRDAEIRAVNRFDASITAHDRWRPYSRRGSSDPGTRAEAAALGETRVEHHPAYRGRLRRRIGDLIAEIVVTHTGPQDADAHDRDEEHDPPDSGQQRSHWQIHLRYKRPWTLVATSSGTLADAEMGGARKLAEL